MKRIFIESTIIFCIFIIVFSFDIVAKTVTKETISDLSNIEIQTDSLESANDMATIYTQITKISIDAHNLSNVEALSRYKNLKELEIHNLFSGYYDDLYYILQKLPLEKLVIVNTKEQPISIKSSMMAICMSIPKVIIISKEINIIEDNFITNFADIPNKNKTIDIYSNSFKDEKDFFSKINISDNSVSFHDFASSSMK